MTLSSTKTIFGLRLREARLRVGLPQDQLGVLIGLDESTASARISRYESGIHAAPYDIAVRVAQALNIPTPYLYCDDDDLAALMLSWGDLSKAKKAQIKKVIGLLPEETAKK